MSSLQLVAALVKGAEPTDATAERILDAAVEDMRRGSSPMNLGKIATRARVGRVTIYRRFGNKEGLLGAVLLREVGRVMQEVDDAMRSGRSVEARFTQAFVAMLRAIRKRAFIDGALRASPELPLRLLTFDGTTILRLGIAFIAQQIRTEQRAGHLPDYDPDPVAEILARIAHSIVLTPDGGIAFKDDARAASFARAYLVPLVLHGPARGRS
jgi:AcrR family transcriptional regulator